MFRRLWNHAVDRISRHCDRWTARRIRPLVRRGDQILIIEYGASRLALLLGRDPGCEAVIDSGHAPLPFGDGTFDVVLLVSVLHNLKDPRIILDEARRVTRRQVIALEDVNSNRWDRLNFGAFQRRARPYHVWPPGRWSRLAAGAGLQEVWSGLVGRQLGLFTPRQVMFEWQKPAAKIRKAA
jgi:SAM-dependent methyltransferase